MSFEVRQTDKFKASLEEAMFWHYSHNLEQSLEFADRKFLELQQEVENLKNHLERTPYMGQSDEISDLHRFPIYDGRYSITWIIDDEMKVVTIMEFLDSKYPRSFREFKIDE